jgi:hypothetical protein
MARLYTICSTDPNNFNRIKDINLGVAISTKESILHITNINTVANFQILNEDDLIEFELECDTGDPISFTLTNHANTGMSLEGVPGVVNQWIRNKGFPLLLTLGSLRRFYFEEKVAFRLIRMTYNFAVLLGWYGLPENIHSVPYTITVPRRDKDKTDPIRVRVNFVGIPIAEWKDGKVRIMD